MVKKAKRARKKAAPKPKAKSEKTELEAALAPEPEVKPTLEPEVIIEAEEVAPPKPTIGQCANCGRKGPIEELFKCHHCGKSGCPPCGWDKKKFGVCPNCATPVKG